MVNKKFENKDSGEVVIIRGDDGVWFTLDNGAKIKRESFFSKYTEVIDPSSFFNNSDVTKLASQITSIDPSNVPDGDVETNVKKIGEGQIPSPIDQLDYKQKLIKEYLEKNKNKDLSQYRQIDDDEEAAKSLIEGVNTTTTTVDHKNPVINNPNYPEFDPNIKRDRDHHHHTTQQPQQTEQAEQNDAYAFFKNFKKNHEINIDLSFKEYIADPEFLRLMSNNFEADVIMYYTKEIFKNITTDPRKIEDEIYKQLDKIIMGSKKSSKKTKQQKKKIEYPIDKMIKSGKTKSGNDRYIFVDSNSNEVSLTLQVAKNKGYHPKIK